MQAITLNQFAILYAQDRTPVTQKERREIIAQADEWTEAHGWGIYNEGLAQFIDEHQKARESGHERTMIYIEEILTDCNFHHECGLLTQGEYDQARAELKDN